MAVAMGPGALAEFYRRHVAKIVGVGARRFDDPEEVADFVATVFLKVMESAGSFDPRRGTAVAWLYGLAVNVAANQLRQRQRAAAAALRLSGRVFLQPDDYERINEQLDAAARARAVYAAMNGLGPDDRRLLELVAVDGMSPVEAAAALGISPGFASPEPATDFAMRWAVAPSTPRHRPRLSPRRSQHDQPHRPERAWRLRAPTADRAHQHRRAAPAGPAPGARAHTGASPESQTTSPAPGAARRGRAGGLVCPDHHRRGHAVQPRRSRRGRRRGPPGAWRW